VKAQWSSCELPGGRKIYARSPEEMRQRVAAARAGKPITGPQPPWLDSTPAASGGSPRALRPAATATRAGRRSQAGTAPARAGLRPKDVPAIRGILDLAVNRPFRDGHGRLLQLDVCGDGDCLFRGVPVELADGRKVAVVGDGKCHVRESCDGLELLCVPLPGDPAGQTAVEICAEGARFHATAHASGGGRRTQCSESGQMVDHLEYWSLTKIVIAPTEFAFQREALVV